MARSVEATKLARDLQQGVLKQYEGQWIAVHEDTLLGHDPLLDDLLVIPAVRAQMDFPSNISAEDKKKNVPLFMYVLMENFQ